MNFIKYGAFYGLPRIEYLSLKNNNLTWIDSNMLQGLDSLTALILDNNNIRQIKNGSFDGLSKLENLRIGNNKITEINQDTFRNLRNLNRLNLAHNTIQHLAAQSFENLNGLYEVQLQGNQVKCTCDFISTLESIHSGHVVADCVSERSADIVIFESVGKTWSDWTRWSECAKDYRNGSAVRFRSCFSCEEKLQLHSFCIPKITISLCTLIEFRKDTLIPEKDMGMKTVGNNNLLVLICVGSAFGFIFLSYLMIMIQSHCKEVAGSKEEPELPDDININISPS